jgi:ADP-ribose pyrophosphatase YjhB (NUDIX family)
MNTSQGVLHESIKANLLEYLMREDLTFSTLLRTSGLHDSGQLNYHLRLLVRDGLIEKHRSKYRVTGMGERFGVYLKQFQLKEMYPITLVCAVVFNSQGKLLFLKRAKSPQRGRWGFPGGKLVIGETLAEAAERELFEETGLKLKAQRPLGFFPSRVYKRGELSYHANLVPVLMKHVPNGKIIRMDGREHSAYRFIHPKHSSRFELISNNRFIVKLACKHLLDGHFLFKEISFKE